MSRLLSAEAVTFGYRRGVAALSNVTVRVDAGEIVGLIGANGSGKTTLIRLVFDLLRNQAGSIEICDRPNTEIDAKLSAQYLPSEDYLPEFVTGLEYLRLLHSMYGQPLDREAVEEQFKNFSMSGRARDLIEDYSHGMRKKLQLMSAFMLARPLLAIDETLNGIDLEALHLVERELQELRESGVGVLLCTHDFDFLTRVADRVVFLAHGCLVVDAPTEDVQKEYGSIHGMVNALLFGDVDP